MARVIGENGKQSNQLVSMPWHQDVREALKVHRLVALLGPPGVGKTTFAQFIAREATGLDAICLPGGSNVEQYHFYGREGLRSGDTNWVDGPLVSAIKEKRWFLIEDMDKISFDARSPLYGLASPATAFTNPDNSCEVINIPEDFRVVATMNPESSKCSHRAGEVRALYSRFIIIDCPTPTNSQLAKFLKKRFPSVGIKRIKELLGVFEEYCDIRNKNSDGSGENILTLRACENLIKLTEQAGMPEARAINAAIVTQFALDEDLYQSAQLKKSFG